MTAVQLPATDRITAHREGIRKAADLIAAAKRPLILAGRGILLSGAMNEVLEFAERTQTPVAETLLGLGAFPAQHPLSLGMMGMHGEAWVNEAIQTADLLLSFGMRFDDRVTGSLNTYAPLARKIHIDIDPSEINKNVTVDQALIGDLRENLRELLRIVPDCDHSEWLDTINASKGDCAVRDIKNLPDNGHLYAAHVTAICIRPRGQRDYRDRRRSASDVVGPVIIRSLFPNQFLTPAVWARWALVCRRPSARLSPNQAVKSG
jgi:acetolactate synthase-1/2/3 large subunit